MIVITCRHINSGLIPTTVVCKREDLNNVALGLFVAGFDILSAIINNPTGLCDLKETTPIGLGISEGTAASITTRTNRLAAIMSLSRGIPNQDNRS